MANLRGTSRSVPASGLRRLRRVLTIMWGALLIDVVALALLTHIAPAAGVQLFILKGASMEPALPLGALVSVAKVEPDALRVGDIVTARTSRTVIVTHRITAIEQGPHGAVLRTHGDANPSGDLAVLPAAAVLGRVEGYVPALGYVIAFLSTPGGSVGALALVGALLLAIWFLEELQKARTRRVPISSSAIAGASG